MYVCFSAMSVEVIAYIRSGHVVPVPGISFWRFVVRFPSGDRVKEVEFHFLRLISWYPPWNAWCLLTISILPHPSRNCMYTSFDPYTSIVPSMASPPFQADKRTQICERCIRRKEEEEAWQRCTHSIALKKQSTVRQDKYRDRVIAYRYGTCIT